MGLKEKFNSYFTDAYYQKYGDRMASAQGTVLSIKVEESHILWIIRKLTMNIVLKPEAGKGVIKVIYNPKRWFKKPKSVDVKQGQKILAMGLWGEKKLSDYLVAQNIVNLNTNKSIQPFDMSELKKARQSAVKMRYR